MKVYKGDAWAVVRVDLPSPQHWHPLLVGTATAARGSRTA
jgi:hypothetical protein